MRLEGSQGELRSPPAAASATRRPGYASRPSTPRDWIGIGFFTSMGVALLVVLAMFVFRLSGATLEICTPFVLGTMLALLLDPVVDRLQGPHMRRGFAVFAVFSVFLLVIIALGVFGVPVLMTQVSSLAQNGPQYVAKLQQSANTWLSHHHRFMGFTLPRNVKTVFSNVSGRGANTLKDIADQATAILLGSVTTLLEMIVTLIVTFYLLLDIDRLRARLFYLMPERARGPMGQYGRDIGNVFTEYIRGLLIVSAFYGLGTLILFFGLSLVHHDMASYALLVGICGGLLYTIPYVGPLVTAVITFLIAFVAGGAGFGAIAVALTLVLNQLFDNVITPRIVGGGVGLHPVASLFALTLGGTLFGLAGMLLSVPIAASIQAILFRLFPRLTTPTPPAFLRAQGVPPEDNVTQKVLEGDRPRSPQTE